MVRNGVVPTHAKLSLRRPHSQAIGEVPVGDDGVCGDNEKLINVSNATQIFLKQTPRQFSTAQQRREGDEGIEKSEGNSGSQQLFCTVH